MESSARIYRFIYTDELDISYDDFPHLLNLAQKYQLPLMKKKCTEKLSSLLTPENACRLLELALLFDETNQIKICTGYVQACGQVVFESKEFCEIQQSTLIHILKFSYVLDVSETSVCGYCIKWAANRLRNKQRENQETRLETGDGESKSTDSSQNQEAAAESNKAMKRGDDDEKNDAAQTTDETPEAKRSRTVEAIRTELGEALYHIRFPTMSYKEFGLLMNRPYKILDSEDELEVYRCKSKIDANQAVESKFKLTPRRAPPMFAEIREEDNNSLVPHISTTSAWNQDEGFESIARLVTSRPLNVTSVLVAIPADEQLQGCDVRIHVAYTTDLDSDSVIRFNRVELDRDRVYKKADWKRRRFQFRKQKVLHVVVPLRANTCFNSPVDVRINVIMESRDVQKSLLELPAPYVLTLTNGCQRSRVLKVTTQDNAPLLLLGIQTQAGDLERI